MGPWWDSVVPQTQRFWKVPEPGLGPVKEGFLEETPPELCFEGPVTVEEKGKGCSRKREELVQRPRGETAIQCAVWSLLLMPRLESGCNQNLACPLFPPLLVSLPPHGLLGSLCSVLPSLILSPLPLPFLSGFCLHSLWLSLTSAPSPI